MGTETKGPSPLEFKYVRSGNIHLKSAIITLPFAVAGSYIGARLNLMVPDYYLKIFMLVTVPFIPTLQIELGITR